MWSNLLSGTIGSIIGVVGAVVVAYLTVQKTRRDQEALAAKTRRDAAGHAELQRQIDTSGTLAYHLVALYDELKALELGSSEPTDDDMDRLRPLADNLRRSIVVDAPLMPERVEVQMKEARKEITVFLTKRTTPVTLTEVHEVRQTVKTAGDVLQDFRRPKSVGG